MRIPPERRRFAVAAFLVPALLVAGLLATPAGAVWPQFHSGPARLGVSRDRTITRKNIHHLHVRWRRSTSRSVEGINSSPAVAGGRVFIGSDDGRLYSFSVRGKRMWSREIGGAIRSSPAVSGGVVYVGGNGGKMEARDAKTGRLLWWRSLGGAITSSPLVAHGRVYVGSRSGTFYALAARSGRTVWRHDIWSVWDGAAYRDGVVYVGSDQSRVWAFDARTGAQRWSTQLWGRVRSTPAVTRNRLYIVTDQGRVFALNRHTGTQQWSSAAVAPGDGYVRCAAAVAHGLVVVSVGLTTNPMDGTLRAFHARSGHSAWTGELADYSTSSPAYVNGMFLVGSFDHRMYAFGWRKGKALWNSGWANQGGFFNRGISSSPAISNGRIFIGVRDGRLYALGLR